MPAINYETMKGESGRNFDAVTLNENYNVAMQDGTGRYGALKFFKGIRDFFKGIQALGSLAATSRIPVTDANGNVSYATMNDVNNYVINNALTNYAQGKQTALPTGADLNNYKDRGEYLATTDAIGNSCINRPNAQSNIYGFSMSVHNSGNGIVTQKLYCVFGVYTRRYSNAWTSWEKVAIEKTQIGTDFSCRYTEQDKLVTCNLYLNVPTQYSAWVNFINLPKPKDGNIMFKVTKDSGETFNFYVISSTGGLQNGTSLPVGRYSGTVTYISV